MINRTDTFTDTGYFAQASYILTGEDASYGWVKPYHPFDPRNGFLGRMGAGGQDQQRRRADSSVPARFRRSERVRENRDRVCGGHQLVPEPPTSSGSSTMRTLTSTAAPARPATPRTGRTKASSSRNCKSPSGARNRNVSSQIETDIHARRPRRGGERCSRRWRRARSSNHAAQRIVRSDPRTLRSGQRAVRQGLESEDRRRRHYRTSRMAARASRRARSSTASRPTW